jgi:predicted aspartyl protease
MNKTQKYKVKLHIIELDGNSYHIMADVLINGIPVNVIIDTGASRTVFDRSFLGDKLEISTTHDPGEIQSAGVTAGNIESLVATASSFRIGKLELSDFQVILIDLDSISRIYQKVAGKPVHGLLGSDFLLRMNAVIDYGKAIMTLRNSPAEES